jgi:hypothetical protein
MPAEKTQSFCPCSRALNRSGRGLSCVMYEENIPSPKQKILKHSKKGAEGVIGFCKDLIINPYIFIDFDNLKTLSISLIIHFCLSL